MLKSMYSNRKLIGKMIRREVSSRYRGSVFGFLWAFVNPVVMLLIYTFVFSVVFESRWSNTLVDDKASFPAILFVGLIFHGFFSECLNAAPSLIVTNKNYVKKVIFPVEILPVITTGSILVHTIINIFVLLAVQVGLAGALPITVFLCPIILFPLVLITLGLVWLISALGVFIRDIGQSIGLITAGMLFISAVFFPLSALPHAIGKYLALNPLAILIQEGRKVLLFNEFPDIKGLGELMLLSIITAWLGFTIFQKAKKGFSDVL